MVKSKINYSVDILMLVFFIINSITGLIIFFFLPSAVKKGSYQEVLGIIKQKWVDLHNWSGIILLLLIVIHIILHWNWIVSKTKSFITKNKKK